MTVVPRLELIKVGLHVSARQYRSTNRTCILTPDLGPIRENEDRPNSENLLRCNRFLSSRADTFKEAGVSIKILRKEHAYETEAIKMADGKRVWKTHKKWASSKVEVMTNT